MTTPSERPAPGRRSRRAVIGLVLTLAATVATTTVVADAAHAAGWVQVAGVAYDVGIGANGSVWVTGTDDKVWRWNGSSWQDMNGTGRRISVDSSGNAWVVRRNGTIARWTGSSWVAVTGSAQDIGIGGGKVWATGYSSTGANMPLYRWNGVSWDPMGGLAKRVDVDSVGTAMVVQSNGSIWRWNSSNGTWGQWTGVAQDIGVSAFMGQFWATGTGTDGIVYKWNGGSWVNMNGVGVNTDVDRDGNAWVVQSNGAIWHWV